MAGGIGLALYGLGARGKPEAPELPRPPGRLIWAIAAGPDHLAPLAELARRIGEEDGHPVVLSAAPEDLPAPGFTGAPVDSSAAARVWLDHLTPSLIVLAGAELRHALIHEARMRGIPCLLVNGRQPRVMRGREGWYPGLLRMTLALFNEIHVQDETAARAFRKAGAEHPVVSGRMEEPSAALPCNEAERAALARQLGSRPVWLAVDLPEAEEAAVIEAHARTLRLAHRLLLIVVPQDPARAITLARIMETQQGWLVARRSEDQEPEPDVEVLVADSSEYGLWYRLAPICWLGGSLSGTGCLRNPMEAAALGSAIIHGPRPGRWGLAFGRLGAARATRSVASAADMAEALSDLLSPERAARAAHAAWAVVSDGVDVTDRVLSSIRRLLGEE